MLSCVGKLLFLSSPFEIFNPLADGIILSFQFPVNVDSILDTQGWICIAGSAYLRGIRGHTDKRISYHAIR